MQAAAAASARRGSSSWVGGAAEDLDVSEAELRGVPVLWVQVDHSMEWLAAVQLRQPAHWWALQVGSITQYPVLQRWLGALCCVPAAELVGGLLHKCTCLLQPAIRLYGILLSWPVKLQTSISRESRSSRRSARRLKPCVFCCNCSHHCSWSTARMWLLRHRQ